MAHRRIGAAVLTAASCIAASTLGATSAFAAAERGHLTDVPVDIGPSPTGVPANCPFSNGDANFVITNGNGVVHDTTNVNGDWGGQTLEGTATFYEDTTPLYVGHLTVWGGGGNNAKAQTEGGFTLSFNGTSAVGTLSIHIVGHTTTNAAGTTTANILRVNIACA